MLTKFLRAAAGLSTPAPPTSTDPNFNSVSLLLHGDGTNGSQNNTFLDSSTNNFTISRFGNTTQGTFNPFVSSPPYSPSVNGGSLYFDGNEDYLNTSYSTTAFDWWTSDFTVEAWVYPTTLAGWGSSSGVYTQSSLIGNASPTTNIVYWTFGPYLDGTVKFKYWNGSTSTTVTSTSTISANQWSHVAMTKTSSGIILYVNGVGTIVAAIAGTPQSSNSVPLMVGKIYNASIQGYASNIRIVKGTAVYTTNFTPPTAPLTAITNTSLLLSGTNAGIFDNAIKNNLETVGNAQVSTSVTKFGTGSMSFDGTGDYLQIPNTPQFEFGTGDFTVEAWVWVDSTVNPLRPDNLKNVTVFSTGTNSSTDCSFAVYGSTSAAGVGLEIYQASPAIAFSVAATVTTNSWVHIAFVRSGTTLYGFVNGVRITLGTTSSTIGSINSPKVGIANTPSYTNQFKGYIDDLRVTKGVARYTANFTPPTAAFPNQGSAAPPIPLSVDYLVVAGGGGGAKFSGGGGAGGLLQGTTSLSGGLYSVTVGAAGIGGSSAINTTPTWGGTGGNSIFNGVTAYGGGGGASRTTGNAGLAGNPGGSGGGASPADNTPKTGGLATPAGQGYKGGDKIGNGWGGAGGGGAGAVGVDSSLVIGGNGGNGVQSSISGTATYYAGGGGGSSYNNNTAGLGGLGGGGNGTGDNATVGGAATANTGGGGGGGGYNSAKGGDGGSGIVIISYVGAPVWTGGTVTSSGGNTIHTFTTSGSLTYGV